MYDINPILILENTDFKNAFPVYYKSKLIQSNKTSGDINHSPDSSVIAFHNCILRATLVNQCVFDYKNTLMKLKAARDIIVHNTFDKLNLPSLELLLNRDFYPFLKTFSDELGWGEHYCFNNLHSKLAFISSKLQDDLSKQIQLKLEATLAKWNVTKGAAGQNISLGKKNTVEMLQDVFAYPTNCPCCKNKAVVFTKPVMDYNPFLKQEIQVGLDIKSLQCGFCKLKLDNYKELDFLKVKPDLDGKSETISSYSEDC